MKYRVSFFAVFFVSLFISLNVYAKNAPFRCGSDLINLDDTMHGVRSACGEPYSSEVVGERTVYKYDKKKNNKIESNYYLTEWVYEGNNGIYVLTFEGSRLVKKEFIFQ